MWAQVNVCHPACYYFYGNCYFVYLRKIRGEGRWWLKQLVGHSSISSDGRSRKGSRCSWQGRAWCVRVCARAHFPRLRNVRLCALARVCVWVRARRLSEGPIKLQQTAEAPPRAHIQIASPLKVGLLPDQNQPRASLTSGHRRAASHLHTFTCLFRRALEVRVHVCWGLMTWREKGKSSNKTGNLYKGLYIIWTREENVADVDTASSVCRLFFPTSTSCFLRRRKSSLCSSE